VVSAAEPNRLREILLVDDNPLQLRVRKAVLQSGGFQVSVATSAADALAMLRSLSDRIGLVMTDHVMPDGSGSDLVRAIRGENDSLPIVVLSGLPEAIAEYEGLGVIFRAKPFPPAELIELVRKALDVSIRERGAA